MYQEVHVTVKNLSNSTLKTHKRSKPNVSFYFARAKIVEIYRYITYKIIRRRVRRYLIKKHKQDVKGLNYTNLKYSRSRRMFNYIEDRQKTIFIIITLVIFLISFFRAYPELLLRWHLDILIVIFSYPISLITKASDFLFADLDASLKQGQSSFYEVLSTVQTTLFAVVVPFSIAIVQLIFKDKVSKTYWVKLFIYETRTYLLTASSLFFLSYIYLQYAVSFLYWGTLTLMISSVWLIFNIYGIYFFIRTSISFIDPDFRFNVLLSYIVNFVYTNKRFKGEAKENKFKNNKTPAHLIFNDNKIVMRIIQDSVIECMRKKEKEEFYYKLDQLLHLNAALLNFKMPSKSDCHEDLFYSDIFSESVKLLEYDDSYFNECCTITNKLIDHLSIDNSRISTGVIDLQYYLFHELVLGWWLKKCHQKKACNNWGMDYERMGGDINAVYQRSCLNIISNWSWVQNSLSKLLEKKDANYKEVFPLVRNYNLNSIVMLLKCVEVGDTKFATRWLGFLLHKSGKEYKRDLRYYYLANDGWKFDVSLFYLVDSNKITKLIKDEYNNKSAIPRVYVIQIMLENYWRDHCFLLSSVFLNLHFKFNNNSLGNFSLAMFKKMFFSGQSSDPEEIMLLVDEYPIDSIKDAIFSFVRIHSAKSDKEEDYKVILNEDLGKFTDTGLTSELLMLNFENKTNKNSLLIEYQIATVIYLLKYQKEDFNYFDILRKVSNQNINSALFNVNKIRNLSHTLPFIRDAFKNINYSKYEGLYENKETFRINKFKMLIIINRLKRGLGEIYSLKGEKTISSYPRP